MASVYILYSKNLNKYYIGSCLDINRRLEEHINKRYENSYTCNATDWELFYLITDLEYNQSRKIEKHIKAMKSKLYIENLKQFTDIAIRLKEKYK